jgi:hypothetical protein
VLGLELLAGRPYLQALTDLLYQPIIDFDMPRNRLHSTVDGVLIERMPCALSFKNASMEP